MKKSTKITLIVFAISLAIYLIIHSIAFLGFMHRLGGSETKKQLGNLMEVIMQKADECNRFQLNEITKFEWDTAYISWDYASIERKIGCKKGALGHSFMATDLIIAFVSDNEFVAYATGNREVALFDITIENFPTYEDSVAVISSAQVFTVTKNYFEDEGEQRYFLELGLAPPG
jgi:hypothetical protein